MNDYLYQKLIQSADSKIVMLIMDGLGGLSREPGGKSELESAHRPHLNQLAARSALGLSIPIDYGITTGSGPGHVALFGYDPVANEIGRGALEALGVDFELFPGDVAARGNFCVLDDKDLLVDRRAGRLSNADCFPLIEKLRSIKIPGVQFFVEPIKEHRFALIMRAENLKANLSDNDPLKTGQSPLKVIARDVQSQIAARFINEFITEAGKRLKGESRANSILLRGFAQFPEVPSFSTKWGLKPAAIALNGMYRGVSRLVGMDILNVSQPSLDGQFLSLEEMWQDYDFFYIHHKRTDTCGENGDFEGKVAAIEEIDFYIPRLMELKPDVVIITGDHSSPAIMRSHSWHPVPLLLFGNYVRADGIAEFGERACRLGSLGILPAKAIMPLALANAGRLAKYGA